MLPLRLVACSLSWAGTVPGSWIVLISVRALGQPRRPLPRHWRRRRERTPGDCYAKAGRWCLGEQVMYTEGRALSSGLAESDWIPHAWLTATDGGVIDLVGDEEALEATRYFGVRIPTLQVLLVTRRQQPGRDARRVTSLLGPVLPDLIRSGWTPA